MAGGKCQADAGRAVGIAERTAIRWAADPAVQGAIREAQRDALDGIARRLAAGSDRALDVLEEVMQASPVPPGAGTRIRAAVAWLEQRWKATEFQTIEARLSALEEVIGEQHRETTGAARGVGSG